jgi:hypothetical protein
MELKARKITKRLADKGKKAAKKASHAKKLQDKKANGPKQM